MAVAEPAEVAAEPEEVAAEVVAAEVVAAEVALEVVAAETADMGRLGHSTLWWLTRTNRPSTCTICKARIPAYEVSELFVLLYGGEKWEEGSKGKGERGREG